MITRRTLLQSAGAGTLGAAAIPTAAALPEPGNLRDRMACPTI